MSETWGGRVSELGERERLSSSSKRILAVDDDDYARLTVVRHLEKRGYQVTAVASVTAAIKLLQESKSAPFDCVITDYLMPDTTGVELIRWLRQHEPTVAAIMVTAIGEKEIVAETLRSGASNFLDKPVRAPELVAAVEGAVALTERRRELAKTEADAVAIAHIQKRMLAQQGFSGEAGMRISHFPMRGAGGDFAALFPLDEHRSLVVVADVSGHDLRAAFISAYFQGMVRGMVEKQTPVGEVLAYFNRALVREWGSGDLTESTTSLAVCAAEVDRRTGHVAIYNHGFPPCFLLNAEGVVEARCVGGGPPLGWFEDSEGLRSDYTVVSGGSLVCWTDGLDDQASRLGISSWALASLLLAVDGTTRPVFLDDAPDDILVLRIPLTTDGLPELGQQVWLSESYRGCEWTDIDDLQALWVRTFRLTLSDWPAERRDEIALCLREAVLNGLVHGCQKDAEKAVRLEVTFDPLQETVRVHVEDPGPGHAFDWVAYHAKGDDDAVALEEAHRGLVFIHSFANRVETTRRGACLKMEFALKSVL